MTERACKNSSAETMDPGLGSQTRPSTVTAIRSTLPIPVITRVTMEALGACVSQQTAGGQGARIFPCHAVGSSVVGP